MRKILILMACLVNLAGAAMAEPLSTEDALRERVMGDPNAPVLIIEYASLTCPHCANFHNNVLPRIKETWIDTGRARIYYRDLPTSPAQLALALAMVARCAPEEDYFDIVATFYRTQSRWLGIKSPGDALAAAITEAGIPASDAEACLEDRALFEGIMERVKTGNSEYGVDSTPTFVIGGKVYRGMQSYEEFDGLLRKTVP